MTAPRGRRAPRRDRGPARRTADRVRRRAWPSSRTARRRPPPSRAGPGPPWRPPRRGAPRRSSRGSGPGSAGRRRTDRPADCVPRRSPGRPTGSASSSAIARDNVRSACGSRFNRWSTSASLRSRSAVRRASSATCRRADRNAARAPGSTPTRNRASPSASSTAERSAGGQVGQCAGGDRRPAEQLGRLDVRVLRCGPLTGRSRVAPGPVHEAGMEKVQGQQLRLLVGVRDRCLDRLADPAVQPLPSPVGQAFVSRVADQVVLEPEASAALWLQERAQPGEHRGAGDELLAGQQRGQRRTLERGAEHGGVAQHGAFPWRQPVEQAGDHVLERVRQTLDRSGLAGCPSQPPQEQRVAAGPGGQLGQFVRWQWRLGRARERPVISPPRRPAVPAAPRPPGRFALADEPTGLSIPAGRQHDPRRSRRAPARCRSRSALASSIRWTSSKANSVSFGRVCPSSSAMTSCSRALR